MSAKYQAPNSQYNKDETFAKLSIENGFECTIDEAVAVDVDENKFVIFAYISSAGGVSSFGDKEFSFKACPCKFEVIKKTHKGYQDKEVEPNAMHAVLNYVIANDIGFGKPFKAELTGANSKIHDLILTGKRKGQEVSKEDIIEVIKANSCDYEALEVLDKLKDLKMEAPKGFSKGGGMSPGKMLDARLDWIEAALKPDSKWRTVAVALGIEEGDQTEVLKDYFINQLMK